MINRVVLTGRLTKDVELRYTQSGVAVGSFNLAVQRPFKTADGERESDFINAVIWRKAAENFANFTGKGALVAIEGRLQTRNYENNAGQRVYVTEVAVDNFSLLESKADSEHRRQQNGSSNTQQRPQKQSAANPFSSNNGDIDVSDDDLPF
ncbi:single-stranded DNA-binding protein [Fructobacillus fructosus]|uniref:single-stranded DNA-binding protein n=1 Tax=Fructobacillus fructosus TaxID=1631 RepID=UPI002D93D2BF|nr:Single-stranded DNA-binding protein (Ssb) [Fructobacillus fructosus]CAK1251104.1 Single-stranded DNA-binding protein (Ssb) [Fructobacillus fructosus]CAK1252580.1 Single-stranded DNA-binding protein (Ssb) [Fructobacillus fructosus]